MHTRRSFVSSAAIGLSALAARRSWALATAAQVGLVIRPEKVVAHVPSDFMGLSYESSQLIHPEFFSGQNKNLVGYFRTLGSAGVLRIGGNTSEFTKWSPVDAPPSSSDGDGEGPDPGQGLWHRVPTPSFTITPRAIRNLNTFLEASQWRLIYGLNLARGTPEAAAEEAACVAEVCGPRLLALQFGNEPDLFRHDGEARKRWQYSEFIERWSAFEKAVRERLPQVPLAGPDISFDAEWMNNFAAQTKGEVSLLTGHYYSEGPPTDPSMTIERLLADQARFDESVLKAIATSKRTHLPYRMSEGSTCYNAGKKGVSDTFASALWVGDFMARIAAAGGTGVNMHGGADGLYTPIAGSQATGFSARPAYYGMLFARQLSGATMLGTDVTAQGVNVSAYALKSGSAVTVLAFNKSDMAVDMHVRIPWQDLGDLAKVLRLTAPAINATSGVLLGGATVTSDGTWQPQSEEAIPVRGGSFLFRLPAYSGASVTVNT